MVPSSKYTSTEKTGNGFTVKVTDKTIAELFPLNADTDLSIAYTNTSHSEFNEISQFFGSGTFNVKPYLKDEILFSHSYRTSQSQADPAGYVDLCKLRAINMTAGKYQSNCYPYVIFINATQTSTAHNYYWYGINEREESATNRNLNTVYLVSDFDISKAIFTATIRGYTKQEYNKYINTGVSVSDHDIDLFDFINSPSDYYVCHFGLTCSFTWDDNNATWKTVHQNCRITPVLLFNGDTAKGITNVNNAYFAGAFSGSTETQMTSNVSQSVKHSSRTGTLSGKTMGQLYDQIIDTSWCIGRATDLILEPSITQDEWDAYNDITTAFSGTSDKKEFFDDYHYVLYGWESWAWNYDYGTQSGVPCHCTSYDLHLQRLIKGESVSALLASCGVYITDTSNLTTFNGYNISPSNLKSAHIKLGEMAADGRTTGVWINGTALDEYTGKNKSGSIVHGDYNPKPSTGGTGDELTEMLSRGQFYGSGLTKYYVDVPAAKLQKALGDWDNIETGKDVLQNLLSYKILCFPSTTFSNGITEPFVIAGTELKDENDTTITAKKLTSTGAVNLPNITITPTFNDFRDYAPYTKIQMFVPLCGWFDLPPWCMGRKINGEMYINPYSGTVRCLVRADGNVVAELGGNAAIDLPFNATAVGMKSAAVLSNLIQTAGAVGRAVMLPTVNTLAGAGSAALGAICAMNANYTESKGTMGDGSNVYGLYNVYIKITRPATVDNAGNNLVTIPAQYCHDYGRPCNKQLTLTAGDGYTQIMDANITGAMTDREKQMIIDGFKHGLIL